MTEDTMMRIALRGDRARYAALTDEILESVLEAAEADEFILKARAARFETELAGVLGAAHAVGCASTAGALLLVLSALGCGPGDEVLVPAWAPDALSGAVLRTGARPVFVDVSPEDGAPAVEVLAAAVGPATRAVLLGPAGSGGARTALHTAALGLGLPVVGTGRPEPHRPPAPGVTTVVPLGPDDLLGGIGDAAAIVTGDDAVARACRMLRNHGQDLAVRFLHHRVGFNCRMDEAVAAFLLRRLPELEARSTAVRGLADRYTEALRGAGAGVLVLGPEPWPSPYNGLTIVTALRDAVRARLAAHGVEAAVPPFRPHGPAGAGPEASAVFPGAQRLAEQALSLPLYPGLAPADVDLIASVVVQCHAEHRDGTR
ncbi:DegT/DnrJ/EryC1/StrS family aminotransferase [Streptomyces sp. NPDC059851]|uniref:DegT/DnrJ/EryC1/StrS family aminotransferase n=1 Tax=Streptomyces sp. NPDC059851 TaxID=3346971 RepID=UPI0036566676